MEATRDELAPILTGSYLTPQYCKGMDYKRNVRCNKMLLKLKGDVEIKCPNCGHINRLRSDKTITDEIISG